MAQFDDYKKNLKKTEQEILALIERFVWRVVEKIRADAVRIIEKGGPHGPAIASGELRKGLTTDVLKTVAHIVGVVGVSASVPYGVFRHEDTKPHFPPLEPIQRWVRMKGLAGNFSVATHRRLGNRAIQDAQDRAIAFLIARSIARKGTKGLQFLKLALDQNMGWIQAELTKVHL